MEQKLFVGDRVLIADANECTFGVSPEMYHLQGQFATVIFAEWSEKYSSWHYGLDVDNMRWWWCDHCLERVFMDDLPEFEVNSDIVDLLA